MIEAPRGAFLTAEVFSKLVDYIGKILDSAAKVSPLEKAKTPEEVRAYARSIERTQPSFAQDLHAAAGRADE